MNTETIGIKEAAEFLGFKGTTRLSTKAKAGLIPGAFKISNRWMFLVDELREFARNYHKQIITSDMVRRRRVDSWQLLKIKNHPTTTRDSRSVELECTNLLNALAKETRRNTKKSDEKI